MVINYIVSILAVFILPLLVFAQSPRKNLKSSVKVINDINNGKLEVGNIDKECAGEKQIKLQAQSSDKNCFKTLNKSDIALMEKLLLKSGQSLERISNGHFDETSVIGSINFQDLQKIEDEDTRKQVALIIAEKERQATEMIINETESEFLDALTGGRDLSKVNEKIDVLAKRLSLSYGKKDNFITPDMLKANYLEKADSYAVLKKLQHFYPDGIEFNEKGKLKLSAKFFKENVAVQNNTPQGKWLQVGLEGLYPEEMRKLLLPTKKTISQTRREKKTIVKKNGRRQSKVTKVVEVPYEHTYTGVDVEVASIGGLVIRNRDPHYHYNRLGDLKGKERSEKIQLLNAKAKKFTTGGKDYDFLNVLGTEKEYAKELESQLRKFSQVSNELLQAAEAGSGFSGLSDKNTKELHKKMLEFSDESMKFSRLLDSDTARIIRDNLNQINRMVLKKMDDGVKEVIYTSAVVITAAALTGGMALAAAGSAGGLLAGAGSVFATSTKAGAIFQVALLSSPAIFAGKDIISDVVSGEKIGCSVLKSIPGVVKESATSIATVGVGGLVGKAFKFGGSALTKKLANIKGSSIGSSAEKLNGFVIKSIATAKEISKRNKILEFATTKGLAAGTAVVKLSPIILPGTSSAAQVGGSVKSAIDSSNQDADVLGQLPSNGEIQKAAIKEDVGDAITGVFDFSTVGWGSTVSVIQGANKKNLKEYLLGDTNMFEQIDATTETVRNGLRIGTRDSAIDAISGDAPTLRKIVDTATKKIDIVEGAENIGAVMGATGNIVSEAVNPKDAKDDDDDDDDSKLISSEIKKEIVSEVKESLK